MFKMHVCVPGAVDRNVAATAAPCPPSSHASRLILGGHGWGMRGAASVAMARVSPFGAAEISPDISTGASSATQNFEVHTTRLLNILPI
ncbi:unnamed protein product [Sphagnum troendelagicum]|uniref:Uncharacterized protein n=2 Tax=Sphagnum TaxID=13804 RepID=A0ABP0TSU4_9BRYO